MKLLQYVIILCVSLGGVLLYLLSKVQRQQHRLHGKLYVVAGAQRCVWQSAWPD